MIHATQLCDGWHGKTLSQWLMLWLCMRFLKCSKTNETSWKYSNPNLSA